ncbi:MAG: glycogen debranching enzyme family protein [Armatimonadetes bacterium]|nr:glycogen debranching enzyme family protein [Armatimonadota bacterium]
MKYTLSEAQCRNFEVCSNREWLLPNGLGGYAMGTVSGSNTRRYHGLLVAAIEPPTVRQVLLANMEFEITGEGSTIGLGCNQYFGTVHPEGYQFLEQFSVGTFAYWRYRAAAMILEKRVAVHPGENATTIEFYNAGQKRFRLNLRPLVCHKFYHENFRFDAGYPGWMTLPKDETVVGHQGVELVLRHPEATRAPAVGWYYRFEYMREVERGLDPRDDLFCPCELTYDLPPGKAVTLVASVNGPAAPFKEWAEPDPSGANLATDLAAAAEKYIIQTPTRTSIIAGYPWFTDWGRDTMISLPGIFLCTQRPEMARKVISDYLSQRKQGLIPNRFVDHDETPEYNTVDATLWCLNAIYKTLVAEWDEKFARACLAAGKEIVDWHQKGTFFGIKVDPQDGLLTQGEEGVQLTWMDAKLGDWVVTPRRGKPVEINGLWINGLRALEWIANKLGEDGSSFAHAAGKAEASFEKKFWKPSLGYYFDTVDPEDASLRPNQVIAMALPFSPVDPEHASIALGAVSRELLTPVGLRTLGPEEPEYHDRFEGTMTDRDAAYHQGTVWPWLMGSYISAMKRFGGASSAELKRMLRAGREMLVECGVGGISEVYDGDEPRRPGGCPFQAWSVAEWLRAWCEDV